MISWHFVADSYRITTKLVPLNCLGPLIFCIETTILVNKLTILADINKEGFKWRIVGLAPPLRKKNEWGRSADEREIETFPLTQNVVKRLDTKRLLQRDWHEETF